MQPIAQPPIARTSWSDVIAGSVFAGVRGIDAAQIDAWLDDVKASITLAGRALHGGQ